MGPAVLAHHRRYFTGPGRLRVWLVLAALLVSTVTAVRINILLSYYTNDLFSSLQQRSGPTDRPRPGGCTVSGRRC